MNDGTMMPRAGVAVAIGLALAGAGTARAREAGVPPVMPPGQTMGVPIAAPLPPGFYGGLSAAYYNAALKDANGKSGGQTSTVIDPALQLIWAPNWQFLGAHVKMFVVQPLVSIDQKRTDPFPPPMQGSASAFGAANIQIQPIDLTWDLAPGLFVNTGLSVFAPTGQWGIDDEVNIGANFWTFAPNLALTYLKDGWNISAQAIYFANTKNTRSDYQSGNEVMLSGTVTKDIGPMLGLERPLSIGPVSYYYEQVTDDDNFGTSYGGMVQGNGKKFAIGAALNTRVGPVNTLLMYTYDAYVRDTVGGGKAWLGLSYKFN